MAETDGLKIVLATNNELIDRFLSGIAGATVVRATYYWESCIIAMRELSPEILILSEFLPGEQADVMTLVHRIRAEFQSTRVIFLMGPEDGETQAKVNSLISLGVYDFAYGEFGEDDLVSLIFNPRTYKSVAHHHTNLLFNKEKSKQVRINLKDQAAGEQRAALRQQVIAFWSPRGGAGCSTLASNLAAYLAMVHPYHILLADLDLRTPAQHILLGLDRPEHQLGTLLPLIEGNRLSRESLADHLVHPAEKLTNWKFLQGLLAAPEMAENITTRHIEVLLEVLRDSADLVILDLNPSLAEVSTYAALRKASMVFMVATQDCSVFTECGRYLNLLNRLGMSSTKWQLVLNRYVPFPRLEPRHIAEVVGLAPAAIVPEGEWLHFLKAAFEGKPLVITGTGREKEAEGFPAGVASLAKIIIPSSASLPRQTKSGFRGGLIRELIARGVKQVAR
ncbi:MAG: AAA family ATPase [Chloroflexi bacterium]|nr:AAA family ATPase [Chloroflexota bacterium]